MQDKLYIRDTMPHGIPIDINLKSAYANGVSTQWGEYGDDPGKFFVRTYISDEDTFTISDEIVSQHATLTLATDKPTILANDTDTATITIASTEMYIDYTVFDHIWNIQFSGAILVVDNVATYQFATAVPGLYHIQMAKQSNYQDGFIDIVAESV